MRAFQRFCRPYFPLYTLYNTDRGRHLGREVERYSGGQEARAGIDMMRGIICIYGEKYNMIRGIICVYGEKYDMLRGIICVYGEKYDMMRGIIFVYGEKYDMMIW